VLPPDHPKRTLLRDRVVGGSGRRRRWSELSRSAGWRPLPQSLLEWNGLVLGVSTLEDQGLPADSDLLGDPRFRL
jgi:hypothetical protein